MKSVEVLKSRLLNNNTLFVQNERGFLGDVGFEWEKPATDSEILEFEKTNNIVLPDSYRDFLKISNGAVLFKDLQYGQWGCNILGLDDLLVLTEQASKWGYKLKPEWIVFATWLGDCDILIFDTKKCASENNNYIVDGEQGELVEDWVSIKGGFAKWIDRLIVAQGAKYWRWFAN